ncbi:exodeoxyribonuclease I subunit C [Tahibacter aquaticus]|uniref:Exodeoxyribonuclease I n=1 Tax=Tahibacter aquaticus TaxID=520092 RepID=A0A4R6YNS3_9GAMM|nr:exodeoxyribonuclease I [Tahibacter aquaticus]TDR39119.1 exodeoxyribonuclease I subunit C [Tahibacter aquaticus]
MSPSHSASYLWHDYETTGADPRRDRPCQFAAIRTSLELDIIGEPVELFCTPAPDVLPHPQATLITGILPQQLLRDGVTEAVFAARVHEEMAVPGTCVVGYNSLRFDDEFTRNLLYRNFYEPYAREWENGNSRWDLIDLVRMCYALRPQGIEWPRRDDGTPSFRLEDLARANRLSQERAHDAVSDVHALIGLARLVRHAQPRLFDFYFALRRKQRAFELLDVAHATPVVHVSSRFPASRGCLAVVLPLAVHASQPNAVIVYDLDADPAELLQLDADAIADRVFSARADLPENVERIPLKLVHANRSPALAPLSALSGVDHERIGLNLERCLAHAERLRGQPGLAAKLQQVFARSYDDAKPDAELALYAGFLNDADKRLLRDVRATPPEQLATRTFAFRDARLGELLWRYRARNWPQNLSADEQLRWHAFCRERLSNKTELTTLTFDEYFATLATLRQDPAVATRSALLDALESWGRERQRELS